MAEAGAATGWLLIPLGTEMPFQEIIEAGVSHQVDCVG